MSRLDGPSAKLGRAREHIESLKQALDVFLQRQPYEVIKEANPAAGEDIYIARVRDQPPERWGLIAGDAIHNARSALDLLYCQLVLANGKSINRGDAFPISDSEEEFTKKGFPRTRGRIAKAARALLSQLKPYKGGYDTLWRLHYFDILDKHRVLLIAGAAFDQMILSTSMRMIPGGEIVTVPPILIPMKVRFPLNDGDELTRISAATTGGEADTELKFGIQIAIGEPRVTEPEPVIRTLNEFASTVDEIIELFRPLL